MLFEGFGESLMEESAFGVQASEAATLAEQKRQDRISRQRSSWSWAS